MKGEGSEGRRGNDVQGVAGGSYVIVGKMLWGVVTSHRWNSSKSMVLELLLSYIEIKDRHDSNSNRWSGCSTEIHHILVGIDKNAIQNVRDWPVQVRGSSTRTHQTDHKINKQTLLELQIQETSKFKSCQRLVSIWKRKEFRLSDVILGKVFLILL